MRILIYDDLFPSTFLNKLNKSRYISFKFIKTLNEEKTQKFTRFYFSSPCSDPNYFAVRLFYILKANLFSNAVFACTG